MLSACPALTSGDAFLGSLLRHIDCQGRTLGLAGYEALSSQTSPLSVVLTSLLVIFVALFGLRLALGEATTLRDAVVGIVKIGIVLTLATSWPAVQVVIYDVVVDGPPQVARTVGLSDITGAGGLVDRLQDADRAIIHLTNLGTGREEFTVLPQPAGSPSGEAPQRFPIADNPAFGWARVLFLSSTVAAFAAVRLTAGLLLALTPLVAALLLFDMARGLFVGWGRALVFSFLASIAVAVVLGVELALLQPWLTDAISARRAGGVVPSAPVELLVLCLAFATALAGSLGLLLRMSFMGHVPFRLPFSSAEGRAPDLGSTSAAAAAAMPPARPATDQAPSRALVVADAVAAAQRRESARSFIAGTGPSAPYGRTPAAQSPAGRAEDLVIPDFGPVSRRTRPRTSLGARLRDHRS